MQVGKLICFIAGCFVGAIITKVYSDIKSEKNINKPEKKEDTDAPKEDKKNTFWEKSSIDEYEAGKDFVDYSKIIDEYTAESESPTDEDDLEELHEKYKNFKTKEIEEEAFGTFGYDCHTVYYNDDRDEFWEEGGEPYEPGDVSMILGSVPEDSGFLREGTDKIFIRNFRLQMDIVLERNNIE